MAHKGSILLNLVNFAPRKTAAVLDSLGNTQKLLEARGTQLKAIPLLSDQDVDTLLRARDSREFKQELELIASEGVETVDLYDPAYPAFLKEISNPPILLYVRGNVTIFSEYLFAIVGTRLPTPYGISMAEDLSGRLAALGFVIVSGLARGIDTAVHRSALGRGRTIAVLGSGLCSVYPKDNIPLASAIAKKGAVISEFPLREGPRKENFPRRNRIISGISRGVLVVEAAQRSGALITAHYALEQNREVFALPGKADSPVSRGSHTLIKEGAHLVDSLDDILEELNVRFTETRKVCVANISSQEKAIFDIIDSEGTSLEALIEKSSFQRPLLNTLILNLQLKGLIREVRPAYFQRALIS
ncbi:MAG: DNA-processing protein DprA [Candidatus Omnitrophota bacterium]|nr:DNA-processing protein DprA [Candidatus Omnitrophota bacterium]